MLEADLPAVSAYWLLGFYLFLALGVSFLCSLLEASLLSIPDSFVEVQVQRARRSGALLKALKATVDRPLAAILTLNTIAHTVGAAGVGAEVLVLFGNEWVAVASAVVTLLILVFSEIIPKTLGARYARELAGFTARTTIALIWLTYPLVRVLEALSRSLGSPKPSRLSRQEIRAVAEMGRSGGALRAEESRVIKNLLRLDRIPLSDVMTPRTVCFMLPREATVWEVVDQHLTILFSRIPVFDGSQDVIVGKVNRFRLHQSLRDGQAEATMGTLAIPIHAVPLTMSVADALSAFIERRQHLFYVVDEFGGTAGIVTLEDAIETLLGVEIVDETDRVDDMRGLARELRNRRRRDHEAASPE